MQVLHAGRYAYHPFSVAPRRRSRRSRPSARVRCRPRASTHGDGLRPLGGAGAEGGLRRGRDHGVGGLPGQPVPGRAHQRPHRRVGRHGREADALRGRGGAPLARPGARGLPDRLPDLAARPGRGRPDLGRGGRARPPARGRRRHGAEHRHRLARGASADDHHPGPAGRLALADRAAQGRGVGAGVRVQPDQQPRHGRGDPRDRRRRPGLDGAPAAGRPRTSSAKAAAGGPTRSTPASPATRRASTRCSPTSTPPAWSTRAPAARPRWCCSPSRRCLPRQSAAPRSRSSAPAPPGSRPRSRPPSAASRSRCSRRTTRSAGSSGWPWPCPARRTSPRPCATTAAGSRCSASPSGSASRRPWPTWRCTTT